MPNLSLDPAVASLVIACLVILFAAGALHKFRDLRRFDEIFSAYGLATVLARTRLSRLVPMLEAAVACGLLFNPTRTPAALLGMALLLLYAAAIAINLRRGRTDLACGCGGPDDRRPIAGWMVWRNAGLAVLAGVGTLPWSARPLLWTDLITVAGGALACCLVYLCLDRLLGRAARMTAQLRRT